MKTHGELRSLEDATVALTSALRDVERDNPVQAVRQVAEVARRCRFPARTSWEAYRYAAEKAVRPYFDCRPLSPAKAAVWAVTDPYFGLTHTSPAREGPFCRNKPKGTRATVVVAGGAR